VPDPTDKGNFSADIGQDVIREALKSVERRNQPEETLDVESPALDAAAEPAAPEVSRELEELRAQLDLSLAKGREMMERVRDSHDKMLRAAADLENFKKRAQKEKEEVQRFGIEKLLKDFIPVLDNLDRAIEHAKPGTDLEGFRQGVVMTRKLFEDTLAKHGVKGFSSKGQPFDPHRHEAMQQVETDALPPNHVHAELLRGFTLNDRLVRPALVMVSKAAATAAPPSNAATTEGKPSDGTGESTNS